MKDNTIRGTKNEIDWLNAPCETSGPNGPEQNENFSENKKNLSEELNKLNNLLKDGVLTQEEFEKAKKNVLEE